MNECTPVPRGTVSDYAPGLSLLSVGYTYVPDSITGESQTGAMYVFGDFNTPQTQQYLRRQFALRHPQGQLEKFTLNKQQP